MGTRGRGRRESDRPTWADERGTDVATLPSFWPEQVTEAVLAEAAHPSWPDGPGSDDEPLWDRWFQRAIEEGVDEDLASLGRSVIRECREQSWDPDLHAECGWFDDGEDMLELALVTPEHALARWRLLLDEG